MITSIARVDEIAFEVTCLLARAAEDAMEQAIVVFIVQSSLIGLTTLKHCVARSAGWGRTPLVSLLVRDGIVVYAGMLALFISVLVSCALKDDRSVGMFFWVLALLSAAGNRLIVNMERLARREGQEHQRTALFTSEISLDPF
ncbi:hypothetical protein HYDPIDRAFT_116223 [Hydnomerulius pinastri MD-312]|uniref:Uncharacterized protein n=1 Tax=Hydnomerulius pinastri MD-312 TaxID=994086 RepID=A0A0C9V6L1_9AGAM|nr:hypothetical protein HYDPIDRAFT_116223 [Hydnomerulius pinastri MD-312]